MSDEYGYGLKIKYKGREKFFSFKVIKGEEPNVTIHRGEFIYTGMTCFTTTEIALAMAQGALMKASDDWDVMDEIAEYGRGDDYGYWAILAAAELLAYPENYKAREVFLHFTD